ncbi:MAG: YggS family pyridoxal phosphate-dependent enzyme, partial [Clostridia bacterium]|nr:YggS family pyridoxal phosphate-dependent enzyme [Clostridia bacterium]
VKYIAGRVDMIESVDSIKLAKEISKEFKKAEDTAKVLVEVNIGKEESKSGCDIEELEDLLCQISELDNIEVKGLMTIPPICDESEARKYFAKMHDKFVELQQKNISGVEMQILSMGMSADYEAAILEGSNIVRVGSAIFGARKYF